MTYLQALLATCLLVSTLACAKEVDPASLYELSTEGTSTRLRQGEQGQVVIEIRATRADAYVSDEAPLRIELSGEGVVPAKTRLTLADSTSRPPKGEKAVRPRFEVPLTAETRGEGQVTGKVVFFICTEKLCVRQQRDLSLPVQVI